MSMAIVTLKKGEGRTLKAGGAWIYDNEIESIMGNAENGEIVLVHDFDGYPLGRGFINRNSKIRVRMMTRHIDQEIDREFLKMRVKMHGTIERQRSIHPRAGSFSEKRISFRVWSSINMRTCSS